MKYSIGNISNKRALVCIQILKSRGHSKEIFKTQLLQMIKTWLENKHSCFEVGGWVAGKTEIKATLDFKLCFIQGLAWQYGKFVVFLSKAIKSKSGLRLKFWPPKEIFTALEHASRNIFSSDGCGGIKG